MGYDQMDAFPASARSFRAHRPLKNLGRGAQGKVYMKFIAGGTGTFGIFLTIKTDGG